MKRYLVILFSLALNLSFGQASWWYGNAGGSAPAGPDTLTLTYWNDFVLLHIANTGITEDVNGVSAWQDRSGNGNHSTQTVTANKPTTDGNGYVVFDGTNDFLTNTTNIFTQASTVDSSFTVFVVSEVSSITSRVKILEFNWYDATDSTLIQLQVDDDGSNFELSYQVDDNSTNSEINLDTFPDATMFLTTIAASQTTTTQARINGVQKSSYSNDGTWATPFTTGADAFALGSNAAGITQYLNGKILFVGIANRKFTPSEIATTESELNSFFTIY